MCFLVYGLIKMRKSAGNLFEQLLLLSGNQTNSYVCTSPKNNNNIPFVIYHFIIHDSDIYSIYIYICSESIKSQIFHKYFNLISILYLIISKLYDCLYINCLALSCFTNKVIFISCLIFSFFISSLLLFAKISCDFIIFKKNQRQNFSAYPLPFWNLLCRPGTGLDLINPPASRHQYWL